MKKVGTTTTMKMKKTLPNFEKMPPVASKELAVTTTKSMTKV